jgi:hypothetical protein
MKQVDPAPIAGGAAPPPAVRRRPATVWIVLLVVVVAAWLLLRPHENKAERLATDVTQAIEKNDMRPVESEFNALRRPELENRAKVGRLADQVIALGALKSVKEDTPKGSPADYHHFRAQFDNATWVEDMTLDADGKIAAFHIHPGDDVNK